MKYLVALLLLAWPLAAAAEPQSIADCEKIKGDLAYNQCLASFGPPARSGAARSSAGKIDAHDQEPEPLHGTAPRRGRVSYGHQAGDTYGRRRGGRQRMSSRSITVTPRRERRAIGTEWEPKVDRMLGTDLAATGTSRG